MSDTNTAAIVAALETLGAEIVSLRGEVQWYADRADEREAENDRLRSELAHAQQRADAATKQAAAQIEFPTWDAVQRLMVQSGVNSIRRLDPFRWRAVSEGREWVVGDSLAEAAVPAANAWAAAHGKVAQA